MRATHLHFVSLDVRACECARSVFSKHAHKQSCASQVPWFCPWMSPQTVSSAFLTSQSSYTGTNTQLHSYKRCLPGQAELCPPGLASRLADRGVVAILPASPPPSPLTARCHCTVRTHAHCTRDYATPGTLPHTVCRHSAIQSVH